MSLNHQISLVMTKRSKSSVIVGKGKATEEKGKRSHFCTKIGMDFNPKTSRLRNQEDVNKHLVRYGAYLNLEIKVEFCPHGVRRLSGPAQWWCICASSGSGAGVEVIDDDFHPQRSDFLQNRPFSVVGSGLAYDT